MADRSPALIVFDTEGLEARATVAIRRKALQTVSSGSGERYELYSNYALQIQAVAASITATP
jgi:hypothetical protein